MAVVITLVIEAATYAGSVALVDGEQLLADRAVAMRGREHEALMPAVAAVLAEGKTATSELGRIVCGSGPGSFTSLRIAGGIAKGLAMAAQVQLVPLSSLLLLVASLERLAPGRYLGAIDALRGEHYVSLFEVDDRGTLGPSPAPMPALVPSERLAQFAGELEATLVAAGDSPSGPIAPRARAATRLTNVLNGTVAADLAAWEPAYGRLAEAQVKWEAAHGRPLVGA
jgi:tRNA threonylcarbamoyladenosine biosynthesis protein TsaB